MMLWFKKNILLVIACGKRTSMVISRLGLLCAILLIYTTTGLAQEWLKQLEGSEGKSIAIDAAKNVYTIGTFYGDYDFDPGPGTFTLSSQLRDIYISKLDANGNFIWAKQIGGLDYDYAGEIKVDGAGNIYVSARFFGTINIVGASTITAVGNYDALICKLDEDGNLLWAKNFGGTSLEDALSVDVDASGNVYTTGYFYGTTDFNLDMPGTAVLTSIGNRDIFVSKLDASGNYVWAKQIGTTGYDQGSSIVITPLGNLYVGGIYVNTLNSIFIAKLDNSGNILWTEAIGPGAINALATDASENLYATGNFFGNVDFDTGSGTFNLIGGAHGSTFVLKLADDGSFGWADGFGAGYSSEGNSILVDASAKVYITGNSDEAEDGGYLTYVAYDAAGTKIINEVSGGTGSATGSSIVADLSGNVYLTGFFNNTVDFSLGGCLGRLSPGGAFVMKKSSSIPTLPIIPLSERNALIALYNATNGAAWTDNSNWLSADATTWYGVSSLGCGVTSLDLSNNQLVGSLPPEMGDLLSLEVLILSFNQLSGPLPASITNLSNLQILYLDNNNTLTGPLPASIGDMTSLREINTQVNAFTGSIPASLANCTALRNLHLEGNQHTGIIPTFLGSLPNLRSINLGFNQFTGTVPIQLGNLPNLNFLSLARNALSGSIPAELGNLNNLQLLDLSRNQLTGEIPFELGNITYLESLQLWSNTLTGSIPGEFVNLSFLKELNLSQNKLEGFVPEIGFNDVLQTLQLADNKFDFIDPVFSSFSELTIVDLSKNRFTSVPIFSASGITQLAVENNYLDFGALEQNLGTTGYTYNPQAKIPPGGLVAFVNGGPLDLFFSTTGSSNSYQWYKNGFPVSGATATDFSLPSAGFTDAGTYFVKVTSSLVTGITLQSMDYYAVTSTCTGPRTSGTLDASFNPLVDVSVDFPALEIQSSGKSIVAIPAGTSINGTSNPNGLVRFNTDGSLDGTFGITNFYPGSQQLIVQPNDKILAVGDDGSFTYLKRLNQNGSVDASFNGPSFDNTSFYTTQFGPIALQPDGKVIYSSFNTFDFQRVLTRLNTDGSVDGTFANADDLGAYVIKVQADGKILVGGFLFGGITRLDASGVPDNSFDIGTGSGDDPVYDIAIQPDGKIILIGLFTEFNGVTRFGIVRLNTDGSVDGSFNPPGISDIGVTGIIPFKVNLLSNGKILIAGKFDSVNGEARKNLVLLNADGTVDCSFDPAGSTNSSIFDVEVQADGKILIVGDYSMYDATTRNGFARINYSIASSCLPAVERAALVALYSSTNGPAWTDKTNWLNTDESTWFGVTVSGCHVTQIDLNQNNLTGTIPIQLGSLSNLDGLDLSKNHLNGAVPAQLGSIATLGNLNLSHNLLSGSIPTSLGNLSVLLFLDLTQNQLSGTIPIELGNLSSLRYLQLSINQLTGSIPTQLGNISTLESLNLSENLLSGSIPVSLGGLPVLGFLDLNHNQLTGTIPSQLGNDTALAFLRLSGNLLSGSIPTSLGNLTNLFLLDLDQNQLTGSIPTQFGNLTQLKFLNLYENQLSGPIPIQLGNLTVLETMDIFTNQLTGSLPKELAGCVQLKHLEVGNNQLSGTLPKELQSLTNLEIFQVDYNNFTGSVPNEYLAWTKIKNLFLSHNQLDAIPTFPPALITFYAVENNNLEFGDLESNMGTTGYSYTPQADLPGGTITINAGSALTIPFSTSGTANQYQWYKNGVLIPGATTTNFFIPSAAVSDAGSYTVNITSTIVTGLTLKSLPFVVNINPVINITLQPSDFIACEGDIATFTCSATGTTNITYQWQFSISGLPATFADVSNGANYSGATTNTLTINTVGSFGVGRYRCRINGDFAVEAITNHEGLFVNPVPTAPGTSGNSGCFSTSITLSATGGINGQYRWYTTATGGTAIAGAVNDTFISPLLTTTTTYHVSINNGSCESARIPVTATVIPLPASPTVTPGISCAPSATVVLGASGGVNGQYRWYTTSSGGSPITGETNNTYSTPLLSTSTNFFVSINNGTCESLRISVLAEIKSCTPNISTSTLQTQVGGKPTLDIIPLVTTVNSPIDVSSVRIVQQPVSGAMATVNNGILQVDYTGISFAGTDRLRIEACDMASHCAQQDITIDVAGEIIVYNGISPNGNGQNDAWIIQYIELLPETKSNSVSVFNRWGDEVFATSNYDNVNHVFKGKNKDGDELPTGTYFYKIEFTSGKKTMTGYLSLKR